MVAVADKYVIICDVPLFPESREAGVLLWTTDAVIWLKT